MNELEEGKVEYFIENMRLQKVCADIEHEKDLNTRKIDKMKGEIVALRTTLEELQDQKQMRKRTFECSAQV